MPILKHHLVKRSNVIGSRRSDSSAKIMCVLQPAVHRSPWSPEARTGQQLQKSPTLFAKSVIYFICKKAVWQRVHVMCIDSILRVLTVVYYISTNVVFSLSIVRHFTEHTTFGKPHLLPFLGDGWLLRLVSSDPSNPAIEFCFSDPNKYLRVTTGRDRTRFHERPMHLCIMLNGAQSPGNRWCCIIPLLIPRKDCCFMSRMPVHLRLFIFFFFTTVTS